MNAEQIPLIYRDGPISLVANAAIASFTSIALRDPTILSMHIIFLTTMLVVAAVRAGLWVAFKKSDPDAPDPRLWGQWWSIGSGITGRTWRLGSLLLFVPEALHYPLLLIFVLTRMATSTIFMLAAYFPALAAFQAGLLIPTALSLAIRGNAIHNKGLVL